MQNMLPPLPEQRAHDNSILNVTALVQQAKSRLSVSIGFKIILHDTIYKAANNVLNDLKKQKERCENADSHNQENDFIKAPLISKIQTTQALIERCFLYNKDYIKIIAEFAPSLNAELLSNMHNSTNEHLIYLCNNAFKFFESKFMNWKLNFRDDLNQGSDESTCFSLHSIINNSLLTCIINHVGQIGTLKLIDSIIIEQKSFYLIDTECLKPMFDCLKVINDSMKKFLELRDALRESKMPGMNLSTNQAIILTPSQQGELLNCAANMITNLNNLLSYIVNIAEGINTLLKKNPYIANFLFKLYVCFYKEMDYLMQSSLRDLQEINRLKDQPQFLASLCMNDTKEWANISVFFSNVVFFSVDCYEFCTLIERMKHLYGIIERLGDENECCISELARNAQRSIEISNLFQNLNVGYNRDILNNILIQDEGKNLLALLHPTIFVCMQFQIEVNPNLTLNHNLPNQVIEGDRRFYGSIASKALNVAFGEDLVLGCDGFSGMTQSDSNVSLVYGLFKHIAHKIPPHSGIMAQVHHMTASQDATNYAEDIEQDCGNMSPQEIVHNAEIVQALSSSRASYGVMSNIEVANISQSPEVESGFGFERI